MPEKLTETTFLPGDLVKWIGDAWDTGHNDRVYLVVGLCETTASFYPRRRILTPEGYIGILQVAFLRLVA